jgi:hypothetical protein
MRYTTKEWENVGANVIEAWKQALEVQDQFNRSQLQIRNFALTLVTAIVGAAGFVVKERLALQLLGWKFSMAEPTLLGGLMNLAGFYFMDRFWYHRLLVGAVAHSKTIEERCADVFPEICVGMKISMHTPIRVLGHILHSDRKIDIFYSFIAAFLLVIMAAVWHPVYDQQPQPPIAKLWSLS